MSTRTIMLLGVVVFVALRLYVYESPRQDCCFFPVGIIDRYSDFDVQNITEFEALCNECPATIRISGAISGNGVLTVAKEDLVPIEDLDLVAGSIDVTFEIWVNESVESCFVTFTPIEKSSGQIQVSYNLDPPFGICR